MAEEQNSQNMKAQFSGLKNNKSGAAHPLDLSSNIIKSHNRNMLEVKKPTSLNSLIIWNISKALEKNPNIELKCAIKAAQARLDCERDVNAMMTDSPEQRYLACAMLAWQQLGHSDAESLYHFIQNNNKTQECGSGQSNNSIPVEVSTISSQESKYSKDVHSMSFGSNTIGPVVKLPVETRIIMRMENSPNSRQAEKKPRAQDRNTKNKIEAACCIDSACAERLAKMDTATTELRSRAGKLAKREAERVELLERAEVAWRDLELGYQRRLMLAEEKEEDLTKQIQKAIEDRNAFKNACTSLAIQLKERGDKAEKDRAALNLVEKEVCERACMRLKLSEECAQTDAVLAECQCRAAQMDRDLQFKEEQTRRKLLDIRSELESSQTITHETERAMRAGLCALREQISQVSEQLIQEDNENALIKTELDDLRQEKMGMVEDLEGCKAACDGRMQGLIDLLKKKRDQLAELNEKVMECRCKLPVDESVEVKRTPSLAALCRCTPEDKIMESCSCTSLRSSLMKNLLEDLFSGLQSEMGGTGTQMPCQLLKCLEDKHNWDRASIVKTNLKNYFSQLLIGELDIAIATSIEKYHAKWVGQSCADTSRMIPDPGEAENEGWQERAIERRAQKLATKLAEQLFQERADQLTQKAKAIVTSGPPPCECSNPTPQSGCGRGRGAAVYPVQVNALSPAPMIRPTSPANAPAYWRQAIQDVTQLRVQIEDLKKDSIKKEDLKLMEEKITKMVQNSSGSGKTDIRDDANDYSNSVNDTIMRRDQKINRVLNSIQTNSVNTSKPFLPKKKQLETNNMNKRVQKPLIIQNNSDKTYKPYKKIEKTYAINMCMCSQKDPTKIIQENKILNESLIEEGRRGSNRKDSRTSKDLLPPFSSSVKQTKPISSSLHSQDISTRSISKSSGQQSCLSNCVCFHKIPSNTSIDKLLETLTKWKTDLNTLEIEEGRENETSGCHLPGKEVSKLNYKNLIQSNSKKTCVSSLDNTLKGKKVPDIEEESVSVSKKSSPVLVDQMQSCRSITCDKQSTINKTNNTPKLSKEENFIQIKNNSKILPKTSSNYYVSNKENEYYSSKGTLNKETFVITPSESEYMGAINLDKSNEDFCKCVNRKEKKSDQPKETIQCMPCKCSCKSLTTKKEEVRPGNGTELFFNEQDQKNLNVANEIQNNVPSKIHQNQSQKIKKPEMFACDCGYDIHFLGVTLTDVNTQNEIEDNRDGKNKQRGNKDSNSKKCAMEEEEKHNKDAKDNETQAIKKDKKCEKCEICKSERLKAKIDKESCKVTPSCECKLNFDNFKSYIDVAFQSQQNNEDKSFDVQSFKDKKEDDESCVCCNSQNIDETKDLEENTFHLLEEHLKKKLEEFKETSCNSTCIPPEEEEKLFTTILKRVRQVIIDSTNKIACKCSNDVENSQGSWNRAYGLLQEYLKTKIKRVQCSCLPDEDNNDTILPDVLGKVCNLIEYDFQRLKDVCVCKKTGLQVKDSKQVCFKDEVPERDNSALNTQNNEVNKTNSCWPQNPQTSAIIKENVSSQVPIYLGMETKSCNPLETFTKNVQTLEKAQESFKSLDIVTADCTWGEKKVDSELLGNKGIEVNKSNSTRINIESKVQLAQFSSIPFVGFASECKNTECTNSLNSNINASKTNVVNDVLKKPIPEKIKSDKGMLISDSKPIRNPKFETKEAMHSQNREKDNNEKEKCRSLNKITDPELLFVKETKTNEMPASVSKNDCICNPINSSSSCQKNNFTKTKSENLINYSNKPYIGYTIDCSCDTTLGACVCAKSVFEADNDAMGTIINKSMTSDKVYEKVSYSYIMKSNPTDITSNLHGDLLSEMTGDLYLHNVLKHKTLYYEEDPKQDCETEISLRDDDEDILLKNSREFFEMAHTTTNTIDDNLSLDTDYSTTEAPLDWCDCCSQSDSHRNSGSLPEKLENLGNDLKCIIKKGNVENKVKPLPRYCDCDMVPICHVKMLVENIENKLVSSKCTCDSMTPKVCPIHSVRF